MARRGAPSSQSAYLPHQAHDERGLVDPNESAFSRLASVSPSTRMSGMKADVFVKCCRFLRTEVFAPEKLPGNISIASAVGVFAAGIVVFRTWGDLLVPA